MLEIAFALKGSLPAAWSIRISFGKHLYMSWHQQPTLTLMLDIHTARTAVKNVCTAVRCFQQLKSCLAVHIASQHGLLLSVGLA